MTVVFDGIVFLLTLSRTWKLSREARAAGIEATLSELILRDGEFPLLIDTVYNMNAILGSLYFGQVIL